MSSKPSLFGSSIGKKVLMALSGIGLILFIIGHLVGNFLIFAGPGALNDYAELLRSSPALIWTARIGLIVILLLHVITAAQLKRANMKARPKGYEYQSTVQAPLSSRTMGLTGSFILFFVIGHLLHLTLGIIHPEYSQFVDAEGRHDVYQMVVKGFSHIELTSAYIVGLLLLGFHLSHGISSFFQTLGINHPRYTPMIQKFAPALALLITLGYISIPLSVVTGFVSYP